MAKWEREKKIKELSNCLYNMQSVTETQSAQQAVQFSCLQGKGTRTSVFHVCLLVFHFISRKKKKKKVNLYALQHFKVVSGQHMESECLLQLPVKGGRWIQS